MREPAPLFTDTFALATWLVERRGGSADVLPRRVLEVAVRLLEDVTAALKGRDRHERLSAADEGLLTLRTLLRLDAATGGLTEAQLLHALELADRIGRQIGGWQRHLDEA